MNIIGPHFAYKLFMNQQKETKREPPVPINPKIKIFNHLLLMVMAISLFFSACTAATERRHPQFPSYRHAMGVMLMWAPEIGIFEKMQDGSSMYNETRSHSAQRFAQEAVKKQFQERHFLVRTIDSATIPSGEMISILSLFRSVNRSIQLHTLGPQIFPLKKTTFEYHLGPVAEILKANSADGLVLVLGHQTGIDLPARNWISIAVVEPGGRIIWYCIHGGP